MDTSDKIETCPAKSEKLNTKKKDGSLHSILVGREPSATKKGDTLITTPVLLQDYSRVGEIRQATGEWLNKLPWDWFFTGTFKEAVCDFTAVNRFKRWVRCIAEEETAKPTCFYALEYGKGLRETPHVHALIQLNKGGLFEIRRDTYWKLWFDINGRNQIKPYDKGRGAGYYLTKYIGKECFGTGRWDILET